MHEGAYKYVEATLRRLPARTSVIELGSRTVAGDWPYSGPVRPLFDGAAYIGVDIAPGPNVDVVADAATYRRTERPPDLPEGWEWDPTPVDTVVCCETLEHTDEAEAICANAHRLLIPGGVFIVTTAGIGRAPHSAVDGGELRAGEFYRNVTAFDLREWLAPFKVAFIDTDTPCDIYALAVK
jgi:SAM-dependent methyltransferase